MMPLGLLSAGETAEVLDVRGDKSRSCCLKISDVKHPGAACRIEDLSWRAGKTIETLNNEGIGALLVKIDETRIAMGRGMAMKVIIRRK